MLQLPEPHKVDQSSKKASLAKEVTERLSNIAVLQRIRTDSKKWSEKLVAFFSSELVEIQVFT